MWRSIASNALTLFIVALIGVGIAVGWGQHAYKAQGPLTEAVCFGVPRGANMVSVSSDLAGQGAIGNAVLMRLGADYTEKSQALKAGNFLLPPGASMEEIVDLLTRSGQSTCGSEINLRIGVAASQIQVRELDPATAQYVELAAFAPGEEAPEAYTTLLDEGFGRFRVTLAEGTTSWQVTESLKGTDFLSGEVAGVPAEGTLAPGSYEVVKGDARADVLERMRVAQDGILTAAWESRADDLPYDTPEEALTMASIIEKETAIPDERPAIASVFVNRLEQGMRLQTDPTVIYGVTEGKGVLGRGLRQSELARATPYNTYVVQGLPPTPIANPGRAAIEAAMNPAETDFLFFVADGTGGHVFASTLAEHNANVRKWRAIESQQQGSGQ